MFSLYCMKIMKKYISDYFSNANVTSATLDVTSVTLGVTSVTLGVTSVTGIIFPGNATNLSAISNIMFPTFYATLDLVIVEITSFALGR